MPLKVELLVLLLLCLLAAGCGGGNDVATDNPYLPEEFQGEVDPTLSPDLQARQGAIKQIFDGLLMFETDFGQFESYAPNIHFTEPRESFNPSGAGLFGWKFNGQPSGADIPVIVYLNETSTGPSEPQERVYSVTGNNPYVIVRKK
jgi:hypothetical protein